MAATTTTTQQQPAQGLQQLPGEGWGDYGRRTMFHALQQAPDFSQLSNDGLAAGADACNVAMATPGTTDQTVACLAGLQRELRARLAGRRALLATRLQGLQAEHDRVYGAGRPMPAAAGATLPAAAGGSEAGGNDGGSKVRKPAGPRGPVPPAFQLPELDTVNGF